MGTYFYPNATNAFDAKKQFYREHHYKIAHCFRNSNGTGYVLFDTVEEVNAWHKQHTGEYFYKAEYEPGTIFTQENAMREIESSYGKVIDGALAARDYSMPILAIGLPNATAFGNRLALIFAKSTLDDDIEYRFSLHYNACYINVSASVSNSSIRAKLVDLLYRHFYDARFKKRIEGSKAELKRRAEEQRKAEERRRAEELRKAEERRLAAERLLAAQQKAEEEKRLYEQRRAEEQRKAEERQKAEESRLADKRRRAEERKRAKEELLKKQAIELTDNISKIWVVLGDIFSILPVILSIIYIVFNKSLSVNNGFLVFICGYMIGICLASVFDYIKHRYIKKWKRENPDDARNKYIEECFRYYL